MKGVVLLIILLTASSVFAQNRAPIRIALRDSTHSLLVVDSLNWNEAWIEVLGDDALTPLLTPLLTPADLVVEDAHNYRSTRDTAHILSVDSIGAIFDSKLSLSFVLDNSASMMDRYDSLVTDLDTILAGLPHGAVAQAIAFDNRERSRNDRFTRREGIYLSQSGFTDSLVQVQRFWHYYDSIRVGFTPFFDALRLAVDNSEETKRPQVIIGVTDGDDNASETSVEDLGRLIHGSHIRLILITFHEESLRIKWLAKTARGSCYVARDVQDLRNLLNAFGLRLTRAYHVRYLFPSLSPSSGMTGHPPAHH